MTRNEKLELIALLEERLKRKAKEDLLQFVLYVMPTYTVNWHHKYVCRKLNDFISGKIKRLMIFMPPRHGKSELVSRRLPAFLLGKNPKASIIATSYSADLASMMNRDVQRIIDSDLYRDIFPDTSLNGKNIRSVAKGSWLRNSDIFEVVEHGGSYRSAGVGGGITGMGGDFIIIDDPIKNQEEANSKIYRNKLWDWYGSTLYTRLEKNGSILLTVTRWHEDDLAGRLLDLQEKDPESDRWDIINFPAICEQKQPNDPREIGEALWPFKYDYARLVGIKASVGSVVFSSLYQQNPTPAEGMVIKREYWKLYTVHPSRFEMMVTSWDCAFKDTDDGSFVVGQVWGKIGADYYLLAQVRGKMDFVATTEAVKLLSALYPRAKPILVENKANGPAVISALKSKVSGMLGIEPRGSKESRAVAMTPILESGNIHLPANEPWLIDFIDECAVFPRGTNDDQVDAMTQAINHLEEFGKTAVFSGLFELFGSPQSFIDEDPYIRTTESRAYFFGIYYDKKTSDGCLVGINNEGVIFCVITIYGVMPKDTLIRIKAIVERKEAAFHIQESGYAETLQTMMLSEPWTIDMFKQYPPEIDQMFIELKDSQDLNYPPIGLLFDHMSLLRSSLTDKGNINYEAPEGLSCPAVWSLALAYQCYKKNKDNLMTVGLLDSMEHYLKILED
jgi:predicted phage terminase large subunit-like protein